MKLTLTLIAALTIASPAPAQSYCGPRDDVIEMLADKHDESPRAAGIVAGTTMMEVWAAPGGSWTIFLTGPEGVACMVAAGEDFSLALVTPDGEPM